MLVEGFSTLIWGTAFCCLRVAPALRFDVDGRDLSSVVNSDSVSEMIIFRLRPEADFGWISGDDSAFEDSTTWGAFLTRGTRFDLRFSRTDVVLFAFADFLVFEGEGKKSESESSSESMVSGAIFLALRAGRFSDSHIITGTLWILAVASYAFIIAIVVVLYMFSLKEFLNDWNWLVAAGKTISTVLDVAVAVLLCYFLFSHAWPS